jgi:hypothetical protein
MDHEDQFSTCLLRINSRYRSKDSLSSTDFYYQLGTSEVIDNVYRLALTRFSCLYMFPNIESSHNTLVSNIGVVVIPVGQYTAVQLAALLSGTVIGGTFTVNETTNLFELTANPESNCTIDPSDPRNTLCSFIGITSTISVPASETRSCQTFPNLGGPKSIYVECPSVCQSNCIDGNPASGGYLPLLETIPLAQTPYGYVVNYHTNDLVSSDVDFRKAITLRRIHIRLTDSHTNALTLPSNQEVDIILKVFYKSQ